MRFKKSRPIACCMMAMLYDGHAVIQMLPAPTSSDIVEGMAKTFISYILNSSKAVNEIHIVFDNLLIV